MERERDQGWLILVALIVLSVLVIVSYAMTVPLANWKSPRKPWRSFALIVGALSVGKTLSRRAGEYGRCRHRGRLNHGEPIECGIEKHGSIRLNSRRKKRWLKTQTQSKSLLC